MKKLTVLFAALFFAAMSFGQNTATTTVTGSHNDSDIDQDGNLQTTTVIQTGDYNDSDVDQYNDNSIPAVAAVTQVGDRNEAKIDMDQFGTSTNTPSSAIIDQVGNWNDSYQRTYGPGYSSGVNVYGMQDGDHNDLSQEIFGGYTDRFEAWTYGSYNEVDQEMNSASHSTGYVWQNGDHNKASQFLTGANNGYGAGGITIDQDGNYNEADQDIYSTGGYVDNNDADIKQLGDRNYSKQYAEGWMTDMDADMTGNWNETRQFADGTGNTSKIDILGSYNDVYTDQDDNNNWVRVQVGPEDSYVGDRNDVYVKQNTGGNKADVQVHGSWNDVDIREVNGTGDWHVVKIMKGNHNDIDILADYDGGNRGFWLLRWGSSYNTLDVKQLGKGNIAGGEVKFGSHNDIDVDQIGEDNLIGTDAGNWNRNDGIYIEGDWNTVKAYQNGTGHQATVNIVGSSNVSTTTQY